MSDERRGAGHAGGGRGQLPTTNIQQPTSKGFWAGRVKSFSCAGRGMWAVVRTQRNAWIHAVATVGVVAGAWVLGVTRLEWCLLVLAMGLVWAAEAINTAVEQLADAVAPRRDQRVGLAKDMAAGGVLVAAVAALAVGLVVFLPGMGTKLGL